MTQDRFHEFEFVCPVCFGEAVVKNVLFCQGGRVCFYLICLSGKCEDVEKYPVFSFDFIADECAIKDKERAEEADEQGNLLDFPFPDMEPN